MKEKDIDLMKRYSYEVGRRVPKQQRQDIQLEVENLIEDMYEAAGADADMEQILKSLGSPTDFAKQYNNEDKVLISSMYYDDYCWLMKVVLGCLILGLGVSFILQIIVRPQNILLYLGEGITNLMVGGMAAFGAVTLLFAILERQKIKVDFREAWLAQQKIKEPKNLKEPKISKQKGWKIPEYKDEDLKKRWEPAHMSAVPSKKALISRGDCIVSIVFTVIFCMLFMAFPAFVGVGIGLNNGQVIDIVSPINMDYWYIILPLFLVSMAIGLAEEIQKLVTGRYCIPVMLTAIVNGIIQIIIATVLLKGIPFFNPNFLTELQRELGTAITSKHDLLFYWNSGLLNNLLLALIIVCTLFEIGGAVYKTLRYGIEK